MQFCPLLNFNVNPNSNAFFKLDLGPGFIQFDPQLTIKLLIFFNFTSNFNQLSPHSSTPFATWSLAANFFNLALN
jgi:hypothetical protein